jgi:hypothetical protein
MTYTFTNRRLDILVELADKQAALHRDLDRFRRQVDTDPAAALRSAAITGAYEAAAHLTVAAEVASLVHSGIGWPMLTDVVYHRQKDAVERQRRAGPHDVALAACLVDAWFAVNDAFRAVPAQNFED